MNTIDKKIAIANVVIDAANQQVRLAIMLRKKQRFYNKNRLSRKQKNGVMAMMALTAYMNAIQVSSIMSMPVPKLKA